MTSTITPPSPAPSAGSPTPPPGTGGQAASEPSPPPIAARRLDSRTVAIDVIGLGGLGALAIYGFNTAYGGTRYFLAGVVGLVAGLALAWWGARSRIGVLGMALASVLTYFLIGGAVVTPDETIAGFIPTLDSLSGLVDGAIQGWARLITSVPPVGEASNLLAVPLLCGLFCGLLSLTVSLRSRYPLAAIVSDRQMA